MFISISPSETLRDIYKEMQSSSKSEESYPPYEILEENRFRSKHYFGTDNLFEQLI